MESVANTKKEPVVNIRNLIWNLLSQWKAILIVAVIVALLVPGLKLIKESSEYNEAVEKQKEAVAQASIPETERIEVVLSQLPEEDRVAAEDVIRDQDYLRAEREYLSNSIFINVDPTNQRTLLLVYNISDIDKGNMPALFYSYAGIVNGEEMTAALGRAMNADTDSGYISELISVDNKEYLAIDAEATSLAFEIRVVLPEYADADAAEKAITATILEQSSNIKKRVGKHSISLTSVSEVRLFNQEAIDIRDQIMSNINTTKNYIKNNENSLSEEVKAAITAVETIKNTSDNNAVNPDEIVINGATKPTFSKKFAVFGFVLGVILYAFVYALMVFLKGVIISAPELEYYADTRLLGEVYSETKKKGLSVLLQSRFVDSIRYKDKLDEEAQLSKFATSAEAVCTHSNIEELSLLCMPGVCENINDILMKMEEKLAKKGISVNIVDMCHEFNEKALCDVYNAILIARKGSEIVDVTKMTALCNEFEVHRLGTVYLDPNM